MMFSNYYHVLTRLSCLDKYYDRDDPSLPLLDALREGGFIFPAIDDSNTPQVSILCVLVYCKLYLGMNSYHNICHVTVCCCGFRQCQDHSEEESIVEKGKDSKKESWHNIKLEVVFLPRSRLSDKVYIILL